MVIETIPVGRLRFSRNALETSDARFKFEKDVHSLWWVIIVVLILIFTTFIQIIYVVFRGNDHHTFDRRANKFRSCSRSGSSSTCVYIQSWYLCAWSMGFDYKSGNFLIFSFVSINYCILILVFRFQILPYIDGFNHISKIAALADVDSNLVKSCLQNLVYYGVVTLIPIFQYCAVYCATPKLRQLAMCKGLQKNCVEYCSRSGIYTLNDLNVYCFIIYYNNYCILQLDNLQVWKVLFVCTLEWPMERQSGICASDSILKLLESTKENWCNSVW